MVEIVYICRAFASRIVLGTEEKLDHALKLGAFAAFNYKTEDFSQKVLKATKGKGVNVILDCVGASFWQQNAFVLAMEGRWVLYGLLGGEVGRGGEGAAVAMGGVFNRGWCSPERNRVFLISNLD